MNLCDINRVRDSLRAAERKALFIINRFFL